MTEREAIKAVYSPHHIGTLLLTVAGLADTVRVIVALSERVGPLDIHAILAARSATPQKIQQRMGEPDDRTPRPPTTSRDELLAYLYTGATSGPRQSVGLSVS